MSDLLAILAQSATSLAAHRAASATASHNLSNANTPGYARQMAELAAVDPAERAMRAFLGRGANLLAVRQARDRFIEAQVPRATADAAQTAAEADVLSALSALDPEAAGGMADALGGFYSALRGLSQNAGNAGLRVAVVSVARQLALAFNRAANAIEAARTGVDSKLAAAADEVNSQAAAVADLNHRISVARASGAEPNDLLDARQFALDRLAELAGGAPVPDASGDISVFLANGAALVSGDRSAALSTAPDAANNGRLALRLTLADGTGPISLASGATGGQTGGLLAARDNALLAAGTALDALAFDLGSAANAAHRSGFDLAGAQGGDLFSVGATQAGAARAMAVSPAVAADPSKLAAAGSATSLPGDATNLARLIGTESQALSAGLDAAAALGRIAADFGASAARAAAFAAHDRGVLDHIGSLRESASGVSIDEELIQMTRAQRAFEAVTKVIQTADEMLETLMHLK